MSPAAFIADPLAWLGRAIRELPNQAGRLGALPAWALVSMLLAGLAVALAGARWRRPLALAGGAGLGGLVGLAAAGLLDLPGTLLAMLGAAALGGLSLAFPACFPFAAGALPGALLGARAELGGARLLGAALGLFLAGGLGLLGARLVAALASGLLGAALFAAALAGLAAHAPWLDLLTRRPVLLAAVGLVLAIAGAAFQVGWAWERASSRARRGSSARDEGTGPLPTRAA